uniref:Uncharacterized protein n=1 Tax=Chenopodium quinoa TaxID=63459 RepID=A0A803L494_CHEQI
MLEEGWSCLGCHTALLNVIVALLWPMLASLASQHIAGVSSATADATSQIALPNCPEKCGNISVPYPFGVGDKCHYGTPFDDGRYFNLSCNTSANPPILALGNKVEIKEITLKGELLVHYPISYRCYDKSNTSAPSAEYRAWIRTKRFPLSTTKNVIGAIGCDTFVMLNGTMNNKRVFRSGCMTVCAAPEDVDTRSCTGIGCCLVSIPNGVNNVDLTFSSPSDQQLVQDFNPCSVAFVLAKDHAADNALPYPIRQILTQDNTYYPDLKFPVFFDWSLGNTTCEAARAAGIYMCKGNSKCYEKQYQDGYRCKCNPGSFGRRSWNSDSSSATAGGKSPLASSSFVESVARNVGSFLFNPFSNCIAERRGPFGPFPESQVRRRHGCCPGTRIDLRCGIGTALLKCKKSMPSTKLKSSIGATVKSTCPLQSPSFIVTFLATPWIGLATEFTAFILPPSDIDECADENNNPCKKLALCINTRGSYNCKCPGGYSGNGTLINPCVPDLNTNHHGRYKLLVGLSVTLSSILLFLGGWWVNSLIKKRKVVKQRAKYYERNGGLLMHQQMSSGDGVVERMKVFTIEELEKATDHFNENRILGRGGYGTVYKGMLGEGRIVAVKKAKLVKESNLEVFINEVVILSLINHRNIVKLLGCCLETEIPLLVYEFIPNGTLFHHIHYPNAEFQITWKMRLQIASDSAGALAYLHSSSSIPIFHRDIKSSNILLDDKYRAKLSDFGTSKSVATDQTHVTTEVMGTFGYLDPGYFQSSQFTEKSDVYSFGVVLVELLTGQKAIRAISEEDRSLTTWFLSHMEDSSLLDIIDSQILQKSLKGEFLTIANLAKRCLNLDGKKRPAMKEVLQEIEAVLSIHLSTGKTSKGLYYNDFTSFSTSYMENSSSSSAEPSLLFSR